MQQIAIQTMEKRPRKNNEKTEVLQSRRNLKMLALATVMFTTWMANAQTMDVTWVTNEAQVNSFGSNSSAFSFNCAMLLEPMDVFNYNYRCIQLTDLQKVKVYLTTDAGQITAFSIFVAEVDSDSNLIIKVNQSVLPSSLMAGWNEVTLATPHIFDTSKNTYIGYHIEGAAASFPISLAAANNAKQSYYSSGDTFSLSNVYNIASSHYAAFLIRAVVDTTTTPPYNEVQLSELTMPHCVVAGNQPISAKVKNTGSVNIASVNMQYIIGTDTSTVDTITGLNIPPGSSATITHSTPYTFSAQYYSNIEVIVSNPNGVSDNMSDNKGKAIMYVSNTSTPRVVLHEVFTSSSSAPDKSANERLADSINQINDSTKWAIIKYQVYWPAYGDPYCTQEGISRLQHYGVNSIPTLIGDGGEIFFNNPYFYTLNDFAAMSNVPAMATMTATAECNVSKKTVNFEVDIIPATSANSPDLKFFAAIVEKKTYNNVRTNGQTFFEYVMKKFLTSIDGDSIGVMTAGVTMPTKQYSYTFNGNYRLPSAAMDYNSQYIGIDHAIEHSVENFANLMVVYWIQDVRTNDILQAGKVDAMGLYPQSHIDSLLLVINNLVSDTVRLYNEITNLVLDTVYLRSQNDSLTLIINNLVSDTVRLYNEITNLVTDTIYLQGQNDSLILIINNLMSDTLRLYNEITNLRTDTLYLQGQNDSLIMVINQLVSDSLRLYNEISNLQIDTIYLQSQIDSLSSQIANLQSDTVFLYEQIKLLNEQIITLQGDTANLNAQINKLSLDLSDCGEELQRLITLADSLQAELDDCLASRGVGSVSKENAIQLYPNPTSSQLKIKNYQLKDGENVEIIDVLGRVQQLPIINQQSEIIIDVSHLAKGMYFVRIGNWRGKFVVN
jgi:hypothetical protein